MSWPAPVLAIFLRDYRVLASYRLSFLLDAVYGILNLAVFYFISQAVGDPAPSELAGAPSYFGFAAVGMTLGLVIDAASTGLGERLREEQLTGTLEALLAQPLRSVDLCLGLVSFPFAFAFVRGFAYLLVASVWMHLDVGRTSWLGVAVISLATGAALATLGILSGAIVMLVKRGAILAGTAFFAMTLLSGSVFPVSELPGWLQPLSRILPLRFAFDGFRAALFRGDGWIVNAGALLVFGALGLPFAIWLFSRALFLARRAGSLGQY